MQLEGPVPHVYARRTARGRAWLWAHPLMAVPRDAAVSSNRTAIAAMRWSRCQNCKSAHANLRWDYGKLYSCTVHVLSTRTYQYRILVRSYYCRNYFLSCRIVPTGTHFSLLLSLFSITLGGSHLSTEEDLSHPAELPDLCYLRLMLCID